MCLSELYLNGPRHVHPSRLLYREYICDQPRALTESFTPRTSETLTTRHPQDRLIYPHSSDKTMFSRLRILSGTALIRRVRYFKLDGGSFTDF